MWKKSQKHGLAQEGGKQEKTNKKAKKRNPRGGKVEEKRRGKKAKAEKKSSVGTWEKGKFVEKNKLREKKGGRKFS